MVGLRPGARGRTGGVGQVSQLGPTAVKGVAVTRFRTVRRSGPEMQTGYTVTFSAHRCCLLSGPLSGVHIEANSESWEERCVETSIRDRPDTGLWSEGGVGAGAGIVTLSGRVAVCCRLRRRRRRPAASLRPLSVSRLIPAGVRQRR